MTNLAVFYFVVPIADQKNYVGRATNESPVLQGNMHEPPNITFLSINKPALCARRAGCVVAGLLGAGGRLAL
jgi:hypothetical protein